MADGRQGGLTMAVVTVSRETGTDGDFIIAEVAKRLGVNVVDRQVIEEAAKRAGLPQEILDAKEKEAHSDQGFSSDMVGLVRRSQSGRQQQLADALYSKYMGEAMRQAASQPCVIVGRGAQFILVDRSDVLHVHIYAPESVRVAKVMRERGTLSREQAERVVRTGDQQRAGFIKHYFNNANWRNPDYYNLMIDTARVVPEVAVDLVVMAAQSLDVDTRKPQ
ncbi:MAG: cytidylate kinase-like family protein [Anaerolineae bacterium]